MGLQAGCGVLSSPWPEFPGDEFSAWFSLIVVSIRVLLTIQFYSTMDLCALQFLCVFLFSKRNFSYFTVKCEELKARQSTAVEITPPTMTEMFIPI